MAFLSSKGYTVARKQLLSDKTNLCVLCVQGRRGENESRVSTGACSPSKMVVGRHELLKR